MFRMKLQIEKRFCVPVCGTVSSFPPLFTPIAELDKLFGEIASTRGSQVRQINRSPSCKQCFRLNNDNLAPVKIVFPLPPSSAPIAKKITIFGQLAFSHSFAPNLRFQLAITLTCEVWGCDRQFIKKIQNPKFPKSRKSSVPAMDASTSGVLGWDTFLFTLNRRRCVSLLLGRPQRVRCLCMKEFRCGSEIRCLRVALYSLGSHGHEQIQTPNRLSQKPKSAVSKNQIGCLKKRKLIEHGSTSDSATRNQIEFS